MEHLVDVDDGITMDDLHNHHQLWYWDLPNDQRSEELAG